MNLSPINPFSMTQEQLVEYSMNPDEQKHLTTGSLNKFQVLGTAYKPYDPFTEISKKDIEDNRGEKVPEFTDKQNYKLPKFQQKDPVDVLRDLNVKELMDSFRQEDNEINMLNSLYNQPRGSTPEERAKSQTINKLLIEIDNFAKQYRLSKSQVDTLKTNVLANHLGEYINVKNAIEKQQKDQERAELVAQARGDIPAGEDEGGDEEGEGGEEEGKGGDEEGDEEEAPTRPIADADAGAGAGDLEDAVSEREDAEAMDFANKLIRNLDLMNDADKEIIETGLKTHRDMTWRRALNIARLRTMTEVDKNWFKKNKMELKTNYLFSVYPTGRDVGRDEVEIMVKGTQLAREMLNSIN